MLVLYSKVQGKKKFPYRVKNFCCKTVYLFEQNVLLKLQIRIEHVTKQKLRGAFAGRQERMRRGR